MNLRRPVRRRSYFVLVGGKAIPQLLYLSLELYFSSVSCLSPKLWYGASIGTLNAHTQLSRTILVFSDSSFHLTILCLLILS